MGEDDVSLPTIGIQQCPCTPTCRTYSLTGVGRFYQGSGFSRDEAEEIARRLNCHDDLVAALEALLSNNLGPQIDDGANWDACCDMAKAALAKAGEK